MWFINTDVHTAEKALDAALAAHAAIPARLPLSDVNPGQQFLDTETKLIHHAIRIAAYNTVDIRLDPLPTPRQTAAIAELCQAINDTRPRPR